MFVCTACGTMIQVAAVVKTLEKMRRNPLNWRIGDLESVAVQYGLECRRPGHGGSHVIFSAKGIEQIVSVPAKRPIKPVYVRQFIALVDSSREVERDETE